MIGKAVVCVCLLFFSAAPIQAGTLSGDGVSMGQTNVRAQVVTPQETQAQDTGPRQITGTGRPETSGGTGESVQPVRSGDHSGWPFLLLVSASSGSWIIVSVIGLKRRRRP